MQDQFARRFLADSRDKARKLKTEARDESRSIVYGYMFRVRRGSAKLYFPDRVVQMHRVVSTPAELELTRFERTSNDSRCPWTGSYS